MQTEVLTIRLGFITVGGLIAGVVTAISILLYDAFDAILAGGVTQLTLAEYTERLIPLVVAINLICMAVALMAYRRVIREMASE